MKVLFITWDGSDTNYLESLFLPVYTSLDFDYFGVFQYTWGEGVNKGREACGRYDVDYYPSVLSKSVSILSDFIDLYKSYNFLCNVIKSKKIDVVIFRSTMPALVCIRLMQEFKEIKFVFDTDGFSLDERIENSTLLIEKPLYWLMKIIPNYVSRKSNIVLTRTSFASRYIIDKYNLLPDKVFTVINGRDPKNYEFDDTARNRVRFNLGIDQGSLVVVYVGSLGGKYDLHSMIDFYSKLSSQVEKCDFIIVSHSSGRFIDDVSSMEGVHVINCQPQDVSDYMSAADIGLSFIKQSFSMKGASAIKIGEYLLNRLPVIGTSNIGDSTIAITGAGFILPDLEELSIEDSVQWATLNVLKRTNSLSEQALENGLKYYSLESAVKSYRAALEAL